jgi:hypothetical protein
LNGKLSDSGDTLKVSGDEFDAMFDSGFEYDEGLKNE